MPSSHRSKPSLFGQRLPVESSFPTLLLFYVLWPSHQVEQLLQLFYFYLGTFLRRLAFLLLQRDQAGQSCEQGGQQGTGLLECWV